MEKNIFRILIFKERHACEDSSNALGLVGQFLCLRLRSLLIWQRAEIQAEHSWALSCYSTTLLFCFSEVSLSSVAADPATSEQAADHQTEETPQRF